MITVVQHGYTTLTTQWLSPTEGGGGRAKMIFFPDFFSFFVFFPQQSDRTTRLDVAAFVSHHHFKFGSLPAAAPVVCLWLNTAPLGPVGQEDRRGRESLKTGPTGSRHITQTRSLDSDMLGSYANATAAAGSWRFRWKGGRGGGSTESIDKTSNLINNTNKKMLVGGGEEKRMWHIQENKDVFHLLEQPGCSSRWNSLVVVVLCCIVFSQGS